MPAPVPWTHPQPIAPGSARRAPQGLAMTGDERKRSRSGSQKRRQRRISIGLEPLELDAVDERAEAAGLSRAAYIRAAVLGHPGFRAVPRPPVEKALLGRTVAQLGQAVGQMGRIGNNLNQLAHQANAGLVLSAGALEPVFADVQAAIADMREAVAAVMKALGRDY